MRNAEVEFRIGSKTGRTYTAPDGSGPYGTPDEVLFPSETEFFVRNKYWDNSIGKMVVEMSQI